MAKTISLQFKGYWREVDKGGIPARSGVYVVYVCRYNEQTDRVTLHKLIYIGEAEDVCDRIPGHKKWPEWRLEVPKGSEVCFSFASVTSPDRKRAEAALIYHHKPPCNTEHIDTFPFAETTVKSTGERELLSSPITVYKTR